MKESNINEIKAFFEEKKDYIAGIKTERGHRILKSPIKVGFLGMTMAMNALPGIYEDLVVNGPLKELKTYILSQDHLGKD